MQVRLVRGVTRLGIEVVEKKMRQKVDYDTDCCKIPKTTMSAQFTRLAVSPQCTTLHAARSSEIAEAAESTCL